MRYLLPLIFALHLLDWALTFVGDFSAKLDV